MSELKPRVKFLKGCFQCCRWNGDEWVGFGDTQVKAYINWYLKNELPDEFNLAA